MYGNHPSATTPARTLTGSSVAPLRSVFRYTVRIALALRHLEGDFGPAWREPFARAYGIADIDESKLAFFRLLDELF